MIDKHEKLMEKSVAKWAWEEVRYKHISHKAKLAYVRREIMIYRSTGHL